MIETERVLVLDERAGVTNVICVELTTFTLRAATPLSVTVAPVWNPDPLIVTVVPPAKGPELGLTVVIAGAAAMVKLVVEVAVPLGVVTAIGPLVAPVGTVAEMTLELSTVKVALTPLKVTLVAPVKFVPEIVMTFPADPPRVKKPVIVGAADVTVNGVVLVAVPLGEVTVTLPVVAPGGTVATIAALFTAVKLIAATPLNKTAVTGARSLPLMTTELPTGPLGGEKLTTPGTPLVTVKFVELVADP